MDSNAKIGNVFLQLHKPGNRWRSVLLALFPAGSSGAGRLEILDMGGLGGDAADDHGSVAKRRHQLLRHQKPKVVQLSEVNSVVRVPAHADAPPTENMASFCVGTRDKTLVFAARKDETEDWVRNLHDSTFQREGSSDQRHMEENQIYSSVEEVPEFLVVVQRSDAATRCGLQGSYWLQVAPGSLQLRDTMRRSLVREWPFELLRRYGKDKLVFTIEAGRRCDSGPGTFNFETDRAENIFLLIQSAIREKSSSPGEPSQEGERPPFAKNAGSPTAKRAQRTAEARGAAHTQELAAPAASAPITSMPLPSLPSFNTQPGGHHHHHHHHHTERADPVYAVPEDALPPVAVPQASAPLYVDPAQILPLKPPTQRKAPPLNSAPSQPAFALDAADSVYSEVLDRVSPEQSPRVLACSKGPARGYDEPIYAEPLGERPTSPQAESAPDPFAHLYAQVSKAAPSPRPSAPPPAVSAAAPGANAEAPDDVIYENLGII